LLISLKNKYRIISVVGMAKNAGKTTTLNYLIEEAMNEGIKLGITSTGRDGESMDIVTNTEKPRVYLYPETLVSIPPGLFEYATAGVEILQMTKYHTSLGAAMMCRIVDGGYVQIAGPVLTSDQRNMSKDMLALGADMVLIDGAIDRKSIASPEASDAIILATGAVLSRNMQKVVAETAYLASLYSLKQIGDMNAKELFQKAEKITLIGRSDCQDERRSDNQNERHLDNQNERRSDNQNERHLDNQDIRSEEVYELDIKTGIAASDIIDGAINSGTRYVYIPGALTSSVIENIHPKKFKHVTFVIKDPTKIFISSNEWQKLRKKGFKLEVLAEIKIAAISVNPMSPEGYAFERNEFIEAMRSAMPDIPIIDVKSK